MFHEQYPSLRGSPAVGQAMPSMKFCEICMERKEEDKMFTVQSCKHFFCTECITRHVETKVMTDSVPDVKCPAVGCKLGRVDIDSCNSIVSKECLSKWDELFCASALFLDPNQKFYCPYKNCSGLLLRNTDEVIREAECPHCRRLFCAQCRVPWHSGIGCDQLQELGEDEKEREVIMFRELAKEKEWTRCPACLYYVERTDGCPHMQCRCGSIFCYTCGEENGLGHIVVPLFSDQTYNFLSLISLLNNKPLLTNNKLIQVKSAWFPVDKVSSLNIMYREMSVGRASLDPTA